ncbi:MULTISPECIES: hypothetical protein [unclassified Fusobacterium]|uniref:hypothetical protein n=2 Tax=unclassified Fusobacterium TaxID=2648384 RepID=UPI001B8D0395|nr:MULTISPECIES: hypothetical protein [unclassified Fusobacterium]
MEREKGKMERDKIIKFSKEVVLQVLAVTNTKVEELKKNGEISAAELLEKDVVSKYEKLYKGLDSEITVEEKDKEKLENIYKYICEIMKSNAFTEEFINTQLKKREELKDSSGAEVVKNLFEYEKKQLTNLKYNLLDKVNIVLDEEEKLSMDLKNAIQEDEQMECIYKLQPVREKYRDLENKVLEVQGKLDIVNNKLESKWQYEIYGTLSKEEMLKTFNKTMKK